MWHSYSGWVEIHKISQSHNLTILQIPCVNKCTYICYQAFILFIDGV